MSEIRRVAVLDDYQDVAANHADWSGRLPGVEVHFLHEHLEGADLRAALDGVDAAVAMRERTAFDAARFETLPQLRLLVTTGMRNAAIDLAAAAAHGVTVCGTHGYTHSAAELTWGLILAAMRDIPAEDARIRSGGWQHTVGRDLDGATIGVIGLGRIGGRIAGYAHAFGMHVISWSPFLTPDRAAERGATPVSRERLFADADVVTIHLLLGRRTRGLITEADLRRMRRSSILVNTARGPIVDEAALLRALRERWIRGAALDVYDVEPLPAGHELRRLPNTVLTPHLGYVTERTYATMFAEAVDDIAAFAAGAPVRVLQP